VARHVVFRSPVAPRSFEHAPRDGCAPLAPPSRGHPRGEFPRSIPRRLASPLPSSTFDAVSTGVHEVPTTGMRHMRKHARATLLTLTPTLPSRPDPCGPTCRPDCLSWGCPKIAPPSSAGGRVRVPEAPRVSAGSVRRVSASPGPPSRWECRFPSACRPRGFSPPRRFVPLRPGGHFQAAADRGVHHVSSCRETGFPAVRVLPFEAFPPPTATAGPDESGPPWARVTAPTVSDRRVHRVPCPLALSSRVSAGSGLEALLHRRVRCARGRFRPSVPGAPLGLSGSAAPSRENPLRDEHAGITSKTAPKNGLLGLTHVTAP
jgi:hypothetical protein